MPYHAAEQRSNKQINDSAEYPARGYKLRDFPRSLLFGEQRREAEGQVNGCTFFGSFLYASKEMNVFKLIK